MRSVFDQYDRWENRITPALMTALQEDAGLLQRFCRTLLRVRPRRGRRLTVLEQQLPGALPFAENDSPRRGLPDGWIHDDAAWCVLIESKVQDDLSADQLRRHRQTAERLGFTNITLVVITARNVSDRGLAGALELRWHHVYTWLHQESQRSPWAGRAAAYFDVAEARMVEEEVLTDGQLTTFSGIPFGAEQPYTYREAKRILKLAMERLHDDRRLKTILGTDPKAPGRKAIKGKQGTAVWDYIPLKQAQGRTFTKYPHLTLSILADRLLTISVLPDGVMPSIRRKLISVGEEGFLDLLQGVERNFRPVLRKVPGAAPWCRVVQRHYVSQSAPAVTDALLEFDLRTIGQATPKRRGTVTKLQPEWGQAAFRTWSKKRSHMQLEIGAIFPYRTCPEIREPAALDLVAETWLACEKFLDILTED